MTKEQIERIEKELPEFAKMCRGEAQEILITYSDFPFEKNELLGIAIHYAGSFGKTVHIIP